jgi:hypothetical protein
MERHGRRRLLLRAVTGPFVPGRTSREQVVLAKVALTGQVGSSAWLNALMASRAVPRRVRS